MTEKGTSIVIAGAGSIGCYVGGCLALGGREVTFLARPRIEAALASAGLHVTDLDGRDRFRKPERLAVTTDPASAFRGADIILVTVKSGATDEMARSIAAHARSGAVVISLQNGIDNADRMRRRLGNRWVLAGMVPFNVVQTAEPDEPLRVHRASAGSILVEAGIPGLIDLFDVDGLVVETHPDMKAVLWGKLLLNLNNALVALSDLPLAAELADRRWRVILARQIREALTAMRAAGIEPARIGGVRPAMLPNLLSLPSFLFVRLARRMLAIDPEARSSMWEDLRLGRPTEIDALQGAILRLAQAAGTAAPVCERVVTLVREAEERGKGSPGLKADGVGR